MSEAVEPHSGSEALGRLRDVRDGKTEADDEMLELISAAVSIHPVSRVAEACGWTRQRIYRSVDVPAKPQGPPLDDERFIRWVEALRSFRSAHGRLPTLADDRRLARWLADVRASAKGRQWNGLPRLTEARIATLDEACPGWRGTDERG